MILKMDNTHIKDVANIEKVCFGLPWTYNGIKEELYNPNAYFIVFKEKAVIGYAGMYSVCSEGYINNIAVLPKFRNRGIAKLLLNNLIDYSVSSNLDFLSLEVRISNKAAINLYCSGNFKKVGVRKSFYSNPKEDALIMTRFFEHNGIITSE